jgi:hypothetical protein
MSDHTIHFRLTLKEPNNPRYMQDAGGGFYVPQEIASQLFREVEMLIKRKIQHTVQEHRAKKQEEEEEESKPLDERNEAAYAAYLEAEKKGAFRADMEAKYGKGNAHLHTEQDRREFNAEWEAGQKRAQATEAMWEQENTLRALAAEKAPAKQAAAPSAGGPRLG